MSPLTTRSAALVGAPLLVVLAVVGYPATIAGFVLTALLAAVAIVVGIRRYAPSSHAPWRAFAACASIFGISYTLRFLFPELQALPSENPQLPDFLDAVAFTCAIVGAHRLGTVRNRHKDPTTVIDALILTGGVSAIVWIAVLIPYVTDDQMPPLAQAMGVALSSLSLWLVFVIARLAFGPGAKTPAFYPLGASAFLGMVSQALSSTGAGVTGQWALGAGSFALLCLGLAALHPTMVAMTQTSAQQIGTMSWKRLATMTLAVLSAPVILFTELVGEQHNVAFFSGLIISWVVVTTLVMIRLSGLVRARERMAATERALRQASASLVSARDREETYDAALVAVFEVVGKTNDLRASFAVAGDATWSVVASRGIGSKEAVGRHVDALFMDAMLESNEGGVVQLDDSLPLDAPRSGASCTLVIPLSSRGQIRGAMLVSSSAPLTLFIIEAIESLSNDVSVAIEAIGLAEDLHRRRSEQRFQALVQHSSEITAVLDNAGCITYISPSAERLLGRSTESLVGSPLSSFAHPEDRSVIEELVLLLNPEQASAKSAEIRLLDGRGEWKTLDLIATDLRKEPSVEGIVLNAHDITDRKALEEDLRHKVLHDDLTGIANRVLFRERVDHALTTRQRFDSVTAVLHIDIDDFQTVNDGLGHEIGDELLKVIAFRLESFLRSGDTAARLGGDEFAILLENLYTSEDVTNACRRLLDVVQEPVHFGTRSINVTASIGVAMAGEGSTADLVSRNADVALHHAKSSGKGSVRFFDEKMYESAFERLELKADLQHVLEREELSLHYQPLVGLQDGNLLGFEALLRWTHPTRGFVGPDSFIPLAEETGLIVPIGEWVMNTAMRQLARWRAEAPGREFGISINVSPRQLENESIVEVVRAAINNSGVDPSWVTLELTESSGLDDPVCRERLRALRDLGCEIAADDFGTGFASYAALQQLPFTNVKIDRSLVWGLNDDDGRAAAQLKSIIQMGHTTGLTVTAEGIEDDYQRSVLAELGADKGQGYFFAKPSPAKDAGEWVKRASKAAVVFPA